MQVRSQGGFCVAVIDDHFRVQCLVMTVSIMSFEVYLAHLQNQSQSMLLKFSG